MSEIIVVYEEICKGREPDTWEEEGVIKENTSRRRLEARGRGMDGKREFTSAVKRERSKGPQGFKNFKEVKCGMDGVWVVRNVWGNELG